MKKLTPLGSRLPLKRKASTLSSPPAALKILTPDERHHATKQDPEYEKPYYPPYQYPHLKPPASKTYCL